VPLATRLTVAMSLSFCRASVLRRAPRVTGAVQQGRDATAQQPLYAEFDSTSHLTMSPLSLMRLHLIRQHWGLAPSVRTTSRR
jgi:hypothetical protein